MNIRKYNDRYQKLMSFERDVYNRVKELLPNGISVTDEINEFLNQKAIDLESQSVCKCDKSAIANYENGFDNKIVQKQASLDIYSSNEEIHHHVDNMTDLEMATKAEKNAKMFLSLVRFKTKKLGKEQHLINETRKLFGNEEAKKLAANIEAKRLAEVEKKRQLEEEARESKLAKERRSKREFEHLMAHRAAEAEKQRQVELDEDPAYAKLMQDANAECEVSKA